MVIIVVVSGSVVVSKKCHPARSGCSCGGGRAGFIVVRLPELSR